MVQKTDIILELAMLTIVLCWFCGVLMRDKVFLFGKEILLSVYIFQMCYRAISKNSF